MTDYSDVTQISESRTPKRRGLETQVSDPQLITYSQTKEWNSFLEIEERLMRL